MLQNWLYFWEIVHERNCIKNNCIPNNNGKCSIIVIVIDILAFIEFHSTFCLFWFYYHYYYCYRIVNHDWSFRRNWGRSWGSASAVDTVVARNLSRKVIFFPRFVIFNRLTILERILQLNLDLKNILSVTFEVFGLLEKIGLHFERIFVGMCVCFFWTYTKASSKLLPVSMEASRRWIYQIPG